MTFQLPKLSKISQSTGGSHNDFDYNQLDKDIENAKKLLEKQQNRICDLKQVLTKCRTKSGVPPLIKMSKDIVPCRKKPVTDQFPDCKFTSMAKEMPEFNEHCPRELPVLCHIQPTAKKSDYRPSNPHLGDYDFFAEMQIRDMAGNEVEDFDNAEDEESVAEMQGDGMKNMLQHLPKPSTLDEQDAEFAKLVAEFEAEGLQSFVEYLLCRVKNHDHYINH